MKNTIVIFAIIFSLFSCSKNEEPTTPDPSTFNYRVKTETTTSGSNSNATQYEYNTNGKVSKITYYNGTYAVLTYNSANLLIKYEVFSSSYDIYYINYTYNSSGNVEEAITYQQQTGSTLLDRYKDSFIYSNNRLTQILSTSWNHATNDWHTNPSIANYEYNANGKISKKNEVNNGRYYLMTYDANNNITKTDEYNLQSGSTTQYYLRSSTTRTFDTKKANTTSFSILPNSFNPNYFVSGGNNVIDVVAKQYSETGSVTSTYSETNTYQYNEAGYPTKIVNGATTTEYVLEKY